MGWLKWFNRQDHWSLVSIHHLGKEIQNEARPVEAELCALDWKVAVNTLWQCSTGGLGSTNVASDSLAETPDGISQELLWDTVDTFRIHI